MELISDRLRHGSIEYLNRVLDRMERVMLAPYCNKKIHKHQGSETVSYDLKSNRFIACTDPLYYYFPCTYYPLGRSEVTESDKSRSTALFPNRILKPLSFRESFFLTTKEKETSEKKFSPEQRKDLLKQIRYARVQKNDFESHVDFCDAFHRFFVEGNNDSLKDSTISHMSCFHSWMGILLCTLRTNKKGLNDFLARCNRIVWQVNLIAFRMRSSSIAKQVFEGARNMNQASKLMLVEATSLMSIYTPSECLSDGEELLLELDDSD